MEHFKGEDMDIRSMYKDMPLTKEEEEFIEQSSDSYKRNLTDLVQRLKTTRLFETVEPLISDKEKNKDTILAEDIHPTLLSRYGLLPMSGPVGCDENGGAIRAKVHKLPDVPEQYLEFGFQTANLALVNYALRIAKNEGWDYIYMITQDFANKECIYIRGCSKESTLESCSCGDNEVCSNCETV